MKSLPLQIALITFAALALAEPCSAQGAKPGTGSRIRLLYRIPRQELRVRKDAEVKGNTFRPIDDLESDLEFVSPAFGLDVDTGVGTLSFDYNQTLSRGATTLTNNIVFDGDLFTKRSVVRSRTAYREAEATLSIPFPLDDSLDLRLILGVRYLRFEAELRAESFPGRVNSATNYFIPVIGGGFDFFVFDKTYVFGAIRLLSYNLDSKDTLGLFNSSIDAGVTFREWRAGVRLELVEWGALILDYRSLTMTIHRKGARFRQILDGPAFGVSVKF